MNETLSITKLAIAHDPTEFDCDSEELNNFLRLYALAGQRANISQTYVALNGVEIVGYHTLAVGDVVYAEAPERLAKGLPRYPVPMLLLARLAVDCRWQGKGLGAAVVVDAMRRNAPQCEFVIPLLGSLGFQSSASPFRTSTSLN
jgi:hypothetical protein